MKKLLPALFSTLILGSAAACSQPTAPQETKMALVAGRVRWFDGDSVPHPAPNMKVTLRVTDWGGGGPWSSGSNVVATGLTDENGLFELRYAQDPYHPCSVLNLSVEGYSGYGQFGAWNFCSNPHSVDINLLPSCLWILDSPPPCPTSPPYEGQF